MDKLPNPAPSVASVRARVDECGLIPQPHGGALRPFTPARGAAAARSSIRAIRREALPVLAEGTAAASRRLLELLESDDERVVAIAASQVLDRTRGKPSDRLQVPDGSQRSSAPIQLLNSAEKAELADALLVVSRLAALAQSRENQQESNL